MAVVDESCEGTEVEIHRSPEHGPGTGPGFGPPSALDVCVTNLWSNVKCSFVVCGTRMCRLAFGLGRLSGADLFRKFRV
jgi:hypothetical protein